MEHFNNEQLRRARKADLYNFLLRHHPEQFKNESGSLRPVQNHSISIKRGYTGYKDFSSGETGNSVDFLVREMGYDLTEAVLALCGEGSPAPADNRDTENDTTPASPIQVGPNFPAPVSGPYRQMTAYLTQTRGLPMDTIQRLIDEQLIYQEKSHNNIVFINHEKDWAELRGTLSFRPFHGVLANSRQDGFWWFRTDRAADHIYICEAAIDAISLYLLHRSQGKEEKAYYAGIGGVEKQPAINRIKRQMSSILAVDNDEAGEACRQRNSELPSILPDRKDWNEDWLAHVKNIRNS